jgi:mannose-6-phosphate isomerase
MLSHGKFEMVATRLTPRIVEKPWGRRDLAPWLATIAADAPAVGELVYEDGAAREAAPLLVKTLFTNAPLSLQVHPDDAAAARLGLPRGKDEAWVVLDAEPGATIALGVKPGVDTTALASAAERGDLADLVVHRPVVAGDVLFAPAGTVHAIGAGLKIVEIQQNLDVTYRLYDYGSDRELHLADGLAVSLTQPWTPPPPPVKLPYGRTVAVAGPKFVVERVTVNGAGRLAPVSGRPVWVAVIAGAGRVGGASFAAGSVWRCDDAVEWAFDGAGDVVLTYPGGAAVADLWVAA